MKRTRIVNKSLSTSQLLAEKIAELEITAAVDPEMVEHLRKTAGHRKLCCCCHPLKSVACPGADFSGRQHSKR